MERTYEIHGTGLAVTAEVAAVGEAFDRRLEAFGSRLAGPPALRIEFLARGDGRPSRLEQTAGPSRPVYELAGGGEVFYDAAADVVHGDFDGLGVRCRAAAGRATIEAGDYAGRRLYVAAHALATLCLIELLKRGGRFNLHGACLARAGRGVVVAGPSGVGKSTLAIALAREGLSFLSDDMVYVEHHSRGVDVLAFPEAVGVTAETAELFPELRGLPVAAGFRKRLVTMRALYGGPDVWRCQPDVLVFPELTAAASSRLVGLDPGDALVRLTPDLLLTQPAAAQAQLRAFAALVRQARCYVLEAGRDVAESVAVLVDAL